MKKFFPVLFVTIFGWLSPVFAHPLDLGVIQLQTKKNALTISLDLNPQIAATLLEMKANDITPLVIQSEAENLISKTLRSGSLMRGSEVCQWGKGDGNLVAGVVRLTTTAECPSDSKPLLWDLPFVDNPRIPRTFQVMLRAQQDDEEHVYLAERGKPRLEISFQTQPKFGQFILMGIEHIGATPSEWTGPQGFHLPDGIDHIAFLLALILGGGSILSLLGTATGFTVGHSLTLALATLHIVTLTSRLVESCIALSIAYVAAQTALKKNSSHRWRIAAFFGLVHGFGFASALEGLHLTRASLFKALVGFNLGVELGQAVIIIAMLPIVILLNRPEFFRGLAARFSSALLFLAGAFWFIQRAFLN